MRYRIVKDRKGYRVQRKVLFFWLYFWTEVPNAATQMMEDCHRRFDSEEDAIRWIKKREEIKSDKSKVVKELSL